MWSQFKTIGATVFETERLQLEPLIESHATELYELYSEPRLYEFIPQDPPLSEEALRSRYRFLAARQSPEGDEGWFNWAMRRKSDSACIGCVQITLRNDDRAQIAYDLGVAYWRNGYATEACSWIIAALFESGVREIWAEVDTRNVASMRLLEGLGFVRGALKRDADFFKGKTSDEWTYTLLTKRPGEGTSSK
jgi:RimJ/RimL family protein N-acetyltransferase